MVYLFLGTMGREPVPGEIDLEKGSLFSFDSKTNFKSQLNKISIANGLAWDMKLNKFYYIDSPTRRVDQFDFDIKTGTICK